MKTIDKQYFQRDAFLSEVFGIEWLKCVFPISLDTIDRLMRMIRSLPRGKKIDIQIDARNSELAIHLQQKGWYLGNSKITYLHRPADALVEFEILEGMEIIPLRDRNAEFLVNRAGELFALDRYRSDPNLDRDRISELYRRWMINSIHGRCQEIITAVRDEELLGFICVIGHAEHVFFDLIGVFPGHQHSSLGACMVGSATRKYCQRDIKVVTQCHNLPMQRVLINCGYRPTEVDYIFTMHT